jgi:peptidyl-prolyl cis-trans isomerase C
MAIEKVKIISGLVFASLLSFGLIAYSMVGTKAKLDDIETSAIDALEDVNKIDDIDASGVIAKIGDEMVTYSELSTMLNSSAMVGLSVPALGTQSRNHVMITLLDKVISANLLYLDAKQKGTDKLPSYKRDLTRFEDAILASLYKSKVLIGDIPVSEEEISSYYELSIDPSVEFTDDVKLAIESMIRKQKLKELKTTLRERLRANVNIRLNEKALNPLNDNERSDSEIIVYINDDTTIVWNDIKDMMRGADKRATNAAFYLDNEEERLKRLDNIIDAQIMAIEGRKAGLEKDEAYIKRTEEYRKTRLVNVHRGGLIHSWYPSTDELKEYFVENMDKISVPEARNIQMVVVKTEGEAKAIKKEIDNGEITMYQAAQKYSIDPNAKRTLGEMGWVSEGTGFQELDSFTFNLEPEELGGPVESPAGWHLIKVLDVRDAQLQIFEEAQTQNSTLRHYMKQKLNDYVVKLRMESFDVAVYDDQLQKNFQDEADWIAELNKKAEQQESVTKQRVEGMQKWISEPPTE